ncbi:MAG: 6-carboxytetrahydropterin synthase [Pseudomonadota bacterium]
MPKMPDGHKCGRVHGHSYKIEVRLMGETNPETGMLVDFGDIKKVVQPYIEMFDHYVVNDIGEKHNEPLLMNPTSENLARWFYETLAPSLPDLYSIVVHETVTAYCEYRPQFD